MRLATLLLPLGASIAVGALWMGCSSTQQTPTPDAGVCNNPSDLSARDKAFCPGNKSLDGIAASCGVGCAFNADAGGCTSDCMVQATAGALSPDCSSCFALMVTCARDNCLNECLSEPLGRLCLDCRCGDNFPSHVNCYVAADFCAGIHRDDCERLDAGTWDGYAQGDAGCPPDAGGSDAGGG